MPGALAADGAVFQQGESSKSVFQKRGGGSTWFEFKW